MGRLGCWTCLFAFLMFWPLGCSQNITSRLGTAAGKGVPIVRVRLQQDRQQVMVAANESVLVRASSDMGPQAINFPRSPGVAVVLGPTGWRAGGILLGSGELLLQPTAEGSVSIDGQTYRGRYRFIPVSPTTFDIVNDVDIDGYLKGVIAKELYPNWDEETYKAQAIVARTYALYEAKTTGARRYWDLYPDQRSQVYGGIAAETSKSRRAVDSTSGIVAAYGPAGQERIFKAYFSSCCGGVTQSAADAFGDEWSEPLSDQNHNSLCSASPRYNWGPIVVRKDELTRRFILWARRRSVIENRPRPELNLAAISRIDVAKMNRFGRPVYFFVTDIRGVRYVMRSEEIRTAINTDAPAGTTVFSGYFKTINDPDQIRFVDGHGFGHGVGMCQWCAQRQAEDGVRHEDIILSAFPKARLVRAY